MYTAIARVDMNKMQYHDNFRRYKSTQLLSTIKKKIVINKYIRQKYFFKKI